MDHQPLTLGDYVAVITRRKWWILTLVAIACTTGYAYAGQKGTTYQALVPVGTSYVQPPSLGHSSSKSTPHPNATTRFLANQATLARSNAVLSRAAAAAQHVVPGMTAARLAAASSVTPVATADGLEIAVTNRRAALADELATLLARAYAVERRSVISGQFASVAARTRASIASLENAIQNRTSSPQRIRSLRPELTLEIRDLAALNNYIAEADQAIRVEPSPAPPTAMRASPIKYGLGAAVVGLVIGLIAAFVRDALDSRIRSSDEVTANLELPILAGIPTPPRRLRGNDQLVTLAGTARESEPFRMLAARLRLPSPAPEVRTILITSALAGEGRSTTAANLCVALAELGESVTLIDADLVRPYAARFFSIDQRPGLGDVVAGRAAVSDAMTSVDLPGETGSFAVVPPGEVRGEPASTLGSPALSAVLNAVASQSRFVIMDSPPLLSISHAMVLGSVSDAVLVIARAGQLRTEDAVDLKFALDALPAMKLGVVVTAAEKISGRGYGHGYLRADHGEGVHTVTPGRNGHDPGSAGAPAPAKSEPSAR